jgi:SAM-dependent methyltransferase
VEHRFRQRVPRAAATAPYGPSHLRRRARRSAGDAAFRYLSAEELLWGVSPSADDVVADLGSRTGFYTDGLAAHVRRVYAVDVQEGMHDYYREKGVPENVEPVTAGVGDLPFAADRLDAAVSTMTCHEFAAPGALGELARVVRSGGRLALADWSSDGCGDAGPPPGERFAVDDAARSLRERGFRIIHRATRSETFVLVGSRAQRHSGAADRAIEGRRDSTPREYTRGERRNRRRRVEGPVGARGGDRRPQSRERV